MSGGKFAVENGVPYFVSQNSQGNYDMSEARLLLTDDMRGLPLRVETPEEAISLYPNCYTDLGSLSNQVRVSNLLNSGPLDEVVDVYEGQFILLENGGIQFPASVLWNDGHPSAWGAWEQSNREIVYHFRIVGNLGTMSFHYAVLPQ